MRSFERLLVVATAVAVAAAFVSVSAAVWTTTAVGGPQPIIAAQIAAPSGLTVVKATCVAHSQFTLRFNWTASTPTTYITGYEIAQGPSATGPFTDMYAVAGAGTVTYTTGNRTDWSTTYFFAVRAVAGTWSSTNAVSASFKTPKFANCN